MSACIIRNIVAWDVALMIVLISISFTTPFQLAFYSEGDWSDTSIQQWDTALLIFFALDMIVNFRTSFIESNTGEEIFNSISIVIQYMKGWFVIDLLSTIPFERIASIFLTPEQLIANDTNGIALQVPKLFKVIRIVRLIKLIRLVKVQKLLDYIEDQFDISRNVSLAVIANCLAVIFSLCWMLFLCYGLVYARGWQRFLGRPLCSFECNNLY